MIPPRTRRFSLTRHSAWLWGLPAFGALLIAFAWAATWYQLVTVERVLRGGIARDLMSFAAAFEEHTRRTIQGADRVASVVKYEFEQHGAVDLPQLIRSGIIDADGSQLVGIIDASGKLVASSVPLPPNNVSDREYFRRQAARDTNALDISKPIGGRATGRTLIVLSRRLNHPDGTFAGLVLLSVAPDYFTQFYSEAILGRQGTLELLGTDGLFRARRNGATSATGFTGSDASLVARAEASPQGFFESESRDDGVIRLVAYRKLPGYPFIVTVGEARDEAYAEYFTNRTYRLWIVGIITATILIFFSVVTVLAARLQRHRRDLKAQRQFLQTLVDNLPAGIAVRSMRTDTFGRYVLWNEASEAMFGVKAEDVLGKTVTDVLPPAAASSMLELDRTLLASPMVQEAVLSGEIAHRGRRFVHFVRAPIFGDDDEVEYIMSSATDITDERARNDELRLASKVFETTADGILLTDGDDRIIMINAALSKLTGYGPDDLLGQVLADSPFRPPDVAESDARMVELHRQGFVTGEVPRVRKDGTPLSLWVTATCVRDADGKITNYVRVFTDISLLKATQQKLEQQASYDTLTGLPNRRLLQDRLDHALLRAARNSTPMALMFIDLDGFKLVNDTFGHDIGDRLLCEVASRLRVCIRASDIIGRFGGDEFAIVLENACLPADAVSVCERIVAALKAPFEFGAHRVRTTASIGIAVYPGDGVDAGTLLKSADVAMYRAKQAGRNQFEFFTVEHADAVGAI